MFGIIDAIEEWIRDLLISMITSNLTTLFDDVNTKVGTIATEVGRTPQQWNGGIFNMVRSLSENVMVPIAGIIITFVLCYELITAIPLFQQGLYFLSLERQCIFERPEKAHNQENGYRFSPKRSCPRQGPLFHANRKKL